ncbi:MAG: hypothetical protein ACI935_002128 [Moritella dasanensis]|jgi:hypothetical protein
MKVSIGKELFKESVYVGVSSDEIIAAFEGVTDVYVGSQSDSCVCFHLCRDSHHLGMFTVSDESAAELADTFKELNVYQESKPVMQNAGCLS